MQPVETDRLLIRPFCDDDLPALTLLYQHPAAMHFLIGGVRSPNQTYRNLQQYFHHYHRFGFGLCAVTLKTTGQFIGRAGVEPIPHEYHLEGELAWMLAPTFWRQGLATECATALVTWTWQTLPINRLFATADKANQGSIRIMQNLGMQFVQTYRRSNGTEGVEYELWRQ